MGDNRMKPKSCKCDPYYTCKACRKIDIYTYDQIGSMLGISHQAVYEIEKRAINKLRNNLYLLGYNSLEEIL
jgi:DNA-binding XRE family transcriptional regulator